MAEHTRTPWHVVPGYKHQNNGSPYGVRIEAERGDGFSYRVALCPKHPGIDRSTAEANAAFIVLAANNHEPLVKALEQVHAWIKKDIDDIGLDMLSDDYQALWNEIDPLLVALKEPTR